ncbi:class I SAM-dependent methyltransferase [Hymenobacter sp. GOD-10R]|uniref:class I SAM-dependent methyltransferase n=1 Tax=Hymenobacter sp. GOD-10R TaxID=3093922 RepID=UPI002D77E93B|nr:class I SAM-dependent methyltransferase [Hymenobacter sp. GOD-10R]WRQ27281.1 class I SAM-dependent methyltransferase [Hymenobacter sp. GOD-10R]
MKTPDSGFDRIAGFYDLLASLVFGQALRLAQQAALADLPPGAPRILIMGGGTGWVLGEVLRRSPQAQVLYVEASPAMLRKSQTTLQRTAPRHQAQVEFRLGTEASLVAHETFDVIVTFFFLDLFEPKRLQAVLHQLNAARQPGGVWLLADFCKPPRWWQRVLLAVMYQFFRVTTSISARQLPALPTELTKLGLRMRNRQSFYAGMIEAAIFEEQTEA